MIVRCWPSWANEYRAGSLRAAWNVVLVKERVLAVAHDRVEVEVQALIADQPRVFEAGLERLEERHVLRARGAIAVGRQMPGLGQRVEAAKQAKRGVVHDALHVVASPAARELECQQREHRVKRLKLARARPASRLDQPSKIKRNQLWHEQKEARVLGLDAAGLRPI